MMEEVAAGVTGEAHLREDGEIAPGRIGLGQQGESALGVERAIGDPEFRGRGRDSEEVMREHNQITSIPISVTTLRRTSFVTKASQPETIAAER